MNKSKYVVTQVAWFVKLIIKFILITIIGGFALYGCLAMKLEVANGIISLSKATGIKTEALVFVVSAIMTALYYFVIEHFTEVIRPSGNTTNSE